jgi:hypothetical protein
MTYEVFFQTRDYLPIGDVDDPCDCHLFNGVDLPIRDEAGLTLIYGSQSSPTYVVFVPLDQLLYVETVREQ